MKRRSTIAPWPRSYKLSTLSSCTDLCRENIASLRSYFSILSQNGLCRSACETPYFLSKIFPETRRQSSPEQVLQTAQAICYSVKPTFDSRTFRRLPTHSARLPFCTSCVKQPFHQLLLLAATEYFANEANQLKDLLPTEIRLQLRCVGIPERTRLFHWTHSFRLFYKLARFWI